MKSSEWARDGGQASLDKKRHRFARNILPCNSNSALILCTLPEGHERKGVMKG